MKGMASIQLRYGTFRKQKTNPCPLLLGADQKCSCHVERSATLQREKDSDMLFLSVVDNPLFSAGYKSCWQALKRKMA
ncbi:hypothetical protein TNCV_4003431 [Trichonephila clavipes]|nr:hypothetical protein TNCV_4003431 [Trichonephila clavipes]